MSTRYSYLAGSAAVATVPAGYVVSCVRAHATSAGSLVITPAAGSALPSIPIPAGADWLDLPFDPALQELLPGTTLAFTGTDSYYVGLRLSGGV